MTAHRDETGTVGPAVALLEQDMAFLLRGLESLYRRRKYPVERAQYLLMLQLRDGPRASGDLAVGLRLDHSTVTRQIAALERLGYLIRTPHPEDGRSALLELSALGVLRCSEMQAMRRRGLSKLLCGWTDQEVTAFAGLVARFNDAVCRAEVIPYDDEVQRAPDIQRTSDPS
ncbi:MarR family transcriptional regulator [Paenirhodobacter enshiensis]|uniref:MarR family transcriptional regulator n=1 Tax=Paenirhodobacter enshiensis TaxID=1105367 RepID=UPI00068CEF42|nr:MarR family transcriptional regulator [Paenirhodobacter enshiensis]